MRVRVIVTREPVEAALAALEPFWKSGPDDGPDSLVSTGRGDIHGEDTQAGDTQAADGRGEIGAWLDFHGIVRGTEPDGSRIRAIDYEAHEQMAVHQIERILHEMEARHPIRAALVIHRIGVVPVGSPSLLIRIFAVHRGEALRACAEFIDALKADVPIWKHPLGGDTGPR